MCEFQIEQEKDYAVKLKYIPNNPKSFDKIIGSTIDDIKAKTKNQISITTKKVEKISPFKGKTQFIISQLEK
jgi:hypothetical protein